MSHRLHRPRRWSREQKKWWQLRGKQFGKKVDKAIDVRRTRDGRWVGLVVVSLDVRIRHWLVPAADDRLDLELVCQCIGKLSDYQ
jgi:hypothetical protein